MAFNSLVEAGSCLVDG